MNNKYFKKALIVVKYIFKFVLQLLFLFLIILGMNTLTILQTTNTELLGFTLFEIQVSLAQNYYLADVFKISFIWLILYRIIRKTYRNYVKQKCMKIFTKSKKKGEENAF